MIDWLTVSVGALLVAAAIILASACAAGPQPISPDIKYTKGLAGCVADLALAKEQQRLTDAGIDRPALQARYNACVANVEAVFGFDAGMGE